MMWLPRGRGWRPPEQDDMAVDARANRYRGVLSFVLMMMFLSLLVSKRDEQSGLAGGGRGRGSRGGSSSSSGASRDAPGPYPWDASGLSGNAEVVLLGRASDSISAGDHERPQPYRSARFRLEPMASTCAGGAGGGEAGSTWSTNSLDSVYYPGCAGTGGGGGADVSQQASAPSRRTITNNNSTAPGREGEGKYRWVCGHLVPKLQHALHVQHPAPPTNHTEVDLLLGEVRSRSPRTRLASAVSSLNLGAANQNRAGMSIERSREPRTPTSTPPTAGPSASFAAVDPSTTSLTRRRTALDEQDVELHYSLDGEQDINRGGKQDSPPADVTQQMHPSWMGALLGKVFAFAWPSADDFPLGQIINGGGDETGLGPSREPGNAVFSRFARWTEAGNRTTTTSTRSNEKWKGHRSKNEGSQDQRLLLQKGDPADGGPPEIIPRESEHYLCLFDLKELGGGSSRRAQTQAGGTQSSRGLAATKSATGIPKASLVGQIPLSEFGRLLAAFVDGLSKSLVLIFRSAERLDVLVKKLKTTSATTGTSFGAATPAPTAKQQSEQDGDWRRFLFRSTQNNLFSIYEKGLTDGYLIFTAGHRVSMVLDLVRLEVIEDRFLTWNLLSQDMAKVRRAVPDRYVRGVVPPVARKPCFTCCDMEG